MKQRGPSRKSIVYVNALPYGRRTSCPPNPNNGANYHDDPYSNISFLLMSSPSFLTVSEPGLSIISLVVRLATRKVSFGHWAEGSDT
jgi:hypothetical protein